MVRSNSKSWNVDSFLIIEGVCYMTPRHTLTLSSLTQSIILVVQARKLNVIHVVYVLGTDVGSVLECISAKLPSSPVLSHLLLFSISKMSLLPVFPSFPFTRVHQESSGFDFLLHIYNWLLLIPPLLSLFTVTQSRFNASSNLDPRKQPPWLQNWFKLFMFFLSRRHELQVFHWRLVIFFWALYLHLSLVIPVSIIHFS